MYVYHTHTHTHTHIIYVHENIYVHTHTDGTQRQATGGELMMTVVVWYALNIGWNLSNKNLCNLLKLPLTACALQMTLGSCFMMLQWVFKMRKAPAVECVLYRMCSLYDAPVGL